MLKSAAQAIAARRDERGGIVVGI